MSTNGWLTRRQAIATIGAAAGSMLWPHRAEPSAHNDSFSVVRGRVFEDLNGEGLRGRASRSLAKIPVSNGRDIVMTDADGRWSLPVRSGDSVFVIAPPEWTTSDPSPRGFSYLHQPDGAPAELRLRSPVIAPSRALPSSIDFALQRQPQSRQFEALLFADTQAANVKELGYVRQVLLGATKTSGAAFAVHHGDAMADDLSLFPAYLRILEETGLRWHHCPGNHDMNLDTPDARYAFEAWKRFVGPTNYAFRHAGATFVLLNNVEYLGCGGVTPDGRAYRGRIGDDQLRFVANVLRLISPDDLVVVSMHIPLASFDNPDSAADTTVDGAALLKLLSDRPHTVSFSGHSHTTEHHFLGNREGFGGEMPHHHQVLTAACGSWWSGPPDASGVPVADSRDGTPKGFHVLSVDGNRYETRFVPFGAVADADMRVLLRDGGGPKPGYSLFVDVFDGGPQTRVTCEIEGDPHTGVELERSAIADPYVIEAFARYRDTCKPWVAPAPSSHMWTVTLPSVFESERASLVVRATNGCAAPIVRRVSTG